MSVKAQWINTTTEYILIEVTKKQGPGCYKEKRTQLILYIVLERCMWKIYFSKCILPKLPLFDERVILTYSEDSSNKDSSISLAAFKPINLKPWFEFIKVYLAISIIQKTAVACYGTGGTHAAHR